jgi:hypothetical protein
MAPHLEVEAEEGKDILFGFGQPQDLPEMVQMAKLKYHTLPL